MFGSFVHGSISSPGSKLLGSSLRASTSSSSAILGVAGSPVGSASSSQPILVREAPPSLPVTGQGNSSSQIPVSDPSSLGSMETHEVIAPATTIPADSSIRGSEGPSVSTGPYSPVNAGTPTEPPLSANASAKVDFNWAKNLSSASKFPISSAPVSISEGGRPRVKISNDVFERGAKLHNEFIVGIFYGKAPSYGKIWGVLNFLWGKDRRVTVHHLVRNAYIFHIPSLSLRRHILQHELWRVGDSPFFVTEWKSEFSFNPPSLDKAPVWANITGIPFDLITPEGLSLICTPLGRVVDSKPFTSISAADVKVIVNLTKPLPSEVEIECDDGSVSIMAVTYPWLPPLCPNCNEIGHKAGLCPNDAAKEKVESKGTEIPAKEGWKNVQKKKKQSQSKQNASAACGSNSVPTAESSRPKSQESPHSPHSQAPVRNSSVPEVQRKDKQIMQSGCLDKGFPPILAEGSVSLDKVQRNGRSLSLVQKESIKSCDSQVQGALVIANRFDSLTDQHFEGSPSSASRRKKKRKFSSHHSPVKSDILPLEWRKIHTPNK